MINIKSKKAKYGATAAAVTAIVIAAVVLLNVIVNMLGERYNLKADLTPESIFEITDVTKNYLSSLNQDVEIVTMRDEATFSSSDNIYYKQAYEVLLKYAIYSDRVSLKFVDMVKDPTYANRYAEIYKGNITENSILVSSGEKGSERVKAFTVNDLYNMEINYQTYEYEVTSSKAEQTITSAVMYVTDPNPMTAALFDVEGSVNTAGNIERLLSANGFDTVLINPFTEAIPEDASLLVINAPLNDFSESLTQSVYEFLENGGKYGKNLVYLADIRQKPADNINGLLAEWGVEIGDGVIMDTNPNHLATPSSIFALKNTIEPGVYSQNVAQPSLPVITYESRPVRLKFETLNNISTTPLLTTSETSYVLTDEAMELMAQDIEPDMEGGPFNSIALSSKYVFDENNRQVFSNVLVFGSSLMLDEGLTGVAYYNNGDYFISILDEITGKTGGVNIVAKNLSHAGFDMDMARFRTNQIVFMYVLPLAILACGVIVWLKRRHK